MSAISNKRGSASEPMYQFPSKEEIVQKLQKRDSSLKGNLLDTLVPLATQLADQTIDEAVLASKIIETIKPYETLDRETYATFATILLQDFGSTAIKVDKVSSEKVASPTDKKDNGKKSEDNKDSSSSKCEIM